MAEAAARARTHEPADVSGRRIVLVAGLLAATLVAVALAAGGVMDWLHHTTARAVAPADARPATMPTPPPQSTPAADLAALRREKAAVLGDYRWLDRDRGIVRIPIERAMALLVERGALEAARNATAASGATR
jgi:hypothetical protein